MTLAQRIAHRITDNARLQAVPIAVIEDVLRIGIAAMAEIMPMETKASEVDAIDWDACESCGHLIDAAEPEGAIIDAEGIWICDACKVELQEEPAP